MRKGVYCCLVAMLLLAGCRKDPVTSSDRLTLSAEGRGGNAKMAVEGALAYWVTGDEVFINGETLTVSVDRANSSATVTSGSGFAAPYCGVYPASICSSLNVANASCTLVLPSSYTYATVTYGTISLQSLQTPMVAYAASGTNLMFKHVTAAINVEIVNHYGFTIEVDSLVVESNKYQLCGIRQIALDNTISVSPVEVADAALRRVKMTCTGTLRLLAGETAIVQIPVLPVDSDNKFTVKVGVHKVDQPAVTKLFSKTQTTGGDLLRNQLGYAPAKFGGLFSVSSTHKVIISQGNLQYKASTGKWMFAKAQYESIGDAPGNSNFSDGRSTQSDSIDLFGWATSGWDGASAYPTYHCQPYDYAGDSPSRYFGYGYGPNTRIENSSSYSYAYSLTGTYARCDWGVYNPIANGGNVAGRWRTLTGGDEGEWRYLCATRSASTVGSSANARVAKVKVAGVNGYIVFPDEYTHPAGVATPAHINPSSYQDWSGVTSFSADDWYKMEAEGAVFLPCTGYRSYSNNQPSFIGNAGYYWSTTYASTENAYYVQLVSGTPFYNVSNPRRLGCSVRLVHDVE